MISFDYFLALFGHISNIIKTEIQTANLFNILFVGVIEFAVFYFFSKFAKNIFLKTLIFLFGLKVLFDIIHGNRILTEPMIFAVFGLIAPHFNIFSLWSRYIQKLSLTLKTIFLNFLAYILTPFVYLKQIFGKMGLFFRKKPKSGQKNYKQEKTYKDYFNENKQEKKEYEKQKSEYYKNKQNKNSSHNKNKDEQKQEKKEQQQKKSYQKSNQQKSYQQNKKTNSSNNEQKTYSRWDSPNAYEVLGVSKNANPREIKKAFINLAKKYHPDLTQDKKDEHKIIFQKINNAYKRLKS